MHGKQRFETRDDAADDSRMDEASDQVRHAKRVVALVAVLDVVALGLLAAGFAFLIDPALAIGIVLVGPVLALGFLAVASLERRRKGEPKLTWGSGSFGSATTYWQSAGLLSITGVGLTLGAVLLAGAIPAALIAAGALSFIFASIVLAANSD